MSAKGVRGGEAPRIVTIERAVAGGRMLARDEGRVLLVAGAIPGERVRVRIERTAKQVAWADVVEVLEPSDDRRTPAHDPACGGALYAHIAYPRQRQLKAEVIADACRRIGKMALPGAVEVRPSPETGYRLRARLHLRDGRAGFFREGTHTLCDARATGQLDAGTMPAVERVLAALGSRAADIGELIVAENVSAGERVLHLLPQPSRADRRGQATPPLEGLDDSAGVTGVTTATTEGPVTLAGSPFVHDAIGQATWRRHAASFFQANRFLLAELVAHVVAQTRGGRSVDLYSGVGLFAVALAAGGRTVIAVEGDPVSAADLLANAAAHPRHLAVEQSAVEPFLRRTRIAALDTVILDPPRTGATPEALAGVIAWTAPRIVYVSCDPPTLARDAATLVRAGYTLAAIDAFDLFPNTPHVETVAVFER